MAKDLVFGKTSFGLIRAKKTIGKSTIWLTEDHAPSSAGTWWVVVLGPDKRVRTSAYIRPPQEGRAREVYDGLSMPNVLGAHLEGVAS